VTSPQLIPRCLKWSLASTYLEVEFRRAFDGMHPTLRQVPPSVPLFSIQTVLRPFYPALMAATYPKKIIVIVIIRLNFSSNHIG